MRYPKYAVLSLLVVMSGAMAQPTSYTVDAAVLPELVDDSAVAPPEPWGTLVPTHFVVLPELEPEKMAARDAASSLLLQVGAARAVAATTSVEQTQAALQWTAMRSGQQVAAINIQSTGAYGLRAGVLVERLPDDALLRIYSQEHPNAIVERSGAQINALLAQNKEAGETDADARTWWTPEVGAGDTTVEVVMPAGLAADALRISIPSVSHIYRNLSLPIGDEGAGLDPADAAQTKTVDSCHLDPTCTDNYQTERNAVARMLFTKGGGSYFCTGTLLNNTKADFVPYFLTANHCISNQTVASTLQTRWFYRSSSCNSGVPGPSGWRNGGASLLYATTTTDSTLLQLNEMPPAGVHYAGWEAEVPAQKGQAVYGLHHPGGELLKYGVGSISDYINCQPNGSGYNCGPGNVNHNFYSVGWSQGRTEGGSSGSALFSDGRVMGTLYGSTSRCQAPRGVSYYGRFDKFFNEGASRWLGG